MFTLYNRGKRGKNYYRNDRDKTNNNNILVPNIRTPIKVIEEIIEEKKIIIITDKLRRSWSQARL